MKFLEDVLEALNENITIHDIQGMFKDLKPEFIRTSLKKMWLEDFYSFCEKELDGQSKEVMINLLKFEADCKTIQVIYNSIGNKELSSAASRASTRKHLCPSLGNLYPDCEKEIQNVTALDGKLMRVFVGS
jgi:V-type H+-transporting ATPase subunit d